MKIDDCLLSAKYRSPSLFVTRVRAQIMSIPSAEAPRIPNRNVPPPNWGLDFHHLPIKQQPAPATKQHANQFRVLI